MSASPEIVGPVSSHFVSQGLRLHFVDWGNEEAPPLVLVHGGRDHARSWDWVARALRHRYRVIAPDLRGHGDSEWARGGSYAIQEMVLDLARLVEVVGVGPIRIVGHSLGGSVVLQYAACFPERVERLVAIEGLGPPPKMFEERLARPFAERVAEWTERVRELSAKQPRHYPSIEAAAARMREANSFLSEDQALHLTRHGVARNEDGTYRWKFDIGVIGHMPQRGGPEDQAALWSRIACPVLLVRGAESWASDPEEDGRKRAFRDARLATVERAGHWVHHDRLDAFLGLLDGFLPTPGDAQAK